MNEVKAFKEFLETRQTEEGLTKGDFGVVVPTEIQKEITDLSGSLVKLKKYVTVKDVETSNGKQPVRKTFKDTLEDIKELHESPKLTSNPIEIIKYEIKTKRGFIPYSIELKEDVPELSEVLKGVISDIVTNTENKNIIDALNDIQGTDVSSLDDIKDVINTAFSVNSDIKLYMGQSVFNKLDKIKDSNGNYLLKNTIDNEIVVLDDGDMESDNTIFIGDLKDVVYFDRGEISTNWTVHKNFGECLGVAIRNDVKKLEFPRVKKVNFVSNE